MSGIPEWPEGLARLAGVLLTEETLDAVLEMVVTLAETTVPEIQAASVTLQDETKRRTSNYTHNHALELDLVQYDTSQGPCVHAIDTGRVVNVVLSDQREEWPDFVAHAASRGIHSVLSTPLSVGGKPIGALNLYSGTDTSFDEGQRRLAAQFAEQAAVVLANSMAYSSATRLNDELRQAIETREVIGQAKGIIMVQRKCSREEAFDVLRRASQRTNRKLRDIAAELVESVERSNSSAKDEPEPTP